MITWTCDNCGCLKRTVESLAGGWVVATLKVEKGWGMTVGEDRIKKLTFCCEVCYQTARDVLFPVELV